MANANTRNIITGLDFASIKQNLLNYFQNQSVFSDYNFEGAGLNFLLDLLSYNTHYNAFQANMLSNEMFLSTQLIHDNIVSRANELNYLPRSMTAATSYVNIIVNSNGDPNAPGNLVIPQYTPFLSQAINGTNFQFSTTEANVAPSANGVYYFNNVELIEGIPLTYTFIAANSNPRNIFNLPSSNIDTSTLIVSVIENSPTPAQTMPYILCTDVTVIDGNSRVFFLQGGINATYNLYFGDNILGRSVNAGDIVTITFISTDADAANYANAYTIMSPINGYSNISVQSVSSAAGGSQAETDMSIKLNAPLAFTAQNRCITTEDFKTFLLNRYSNIGSITVWGGDQNIPPVFGQTFISIRPVVGLYLTNLQKQNIINNVLADSTYVTGVVNIVDPDYTYLIVNTNVTYDPNLTSLSQAQLQSVIQTAITNYTNGILGKFDSMFIKSSLDQIIISSEPSIIGSDTKIYLQKIFYPVLNQSLNYTLNFYTELYNGGILDGLYSSPSFIINDDFGNPQTCFIEENPASVLNVSAVNILNPGYGYNYANVSIIGDGTGATAIPVIVNGSIQSIQMTNLGQGYTIADVIISGDGYGAVASSILSASTGTLETYYIYNANRYYITQNQGSVDHTNGIVYLNNFNPTLVNTPTGGLSINIQPESSIITPSRNNILILDPTNPNSIVINLTALNS